jgi:tetratricopeptide (TPR) repeat protein
MKRKAIRTTTLLLKQLEEVPDDPETPYYLSIQYMRAEDWDNCLKYALEAIELFKIHEPDSQLLLLGYHIAATVHYHRKDFEKSIEMCKLSLDIYPSYIDANALLSSIYFSLKQYDNCYKQTMQYFACCEMLKKDKSKSLVIPLNTLKNEWIMNVQLAINFYEQADSQRAVAFLARAEELLKPEDKYKASYEIFKYWFACGNDVSKKRAEAVYKSGFRPG